MTTDTTGIPPVPEHVWVDVTRVIDREQKFMCAFCDARYSQPRSQCQGDPA